MDCLAARGGWLYDDLASMGLYCRLPLHHGDASSDTSCAANHCRIVRCLSGIRFAEAEWQEAWRADPTGVEGKLLVFRVERCARPGLLGQLVSEDLFGVDEESSRSRLLAAVKRGRRKPPLPPGFPLQEAPVNATPFPGRLVSAEIDAAMAAGGPLTPDNPFAVAMAFWHAI